MRHGAKKQIYKRCKRLQQLPRASSTLNEDAPRITRFMISHGKNKAGTALRSFQKREIRRSLSKPVGLPCWDLLQEQAELVVLPSVHFRSPLQRAHVDDTYDISSNGMSDISVSTGRVRVQPCVMSSELPPQAQSSEDTLCFPELLTTTRHTIKLEVLRSTAGQGVS